MVGVTAGSDGSRVVVVGIRARRRWLLTGSLMVGVTGSLCVAPSGLRVVGVPGGILWAQVTHIGAQDKPIASFLPLLCEFD